MSGFSLVIIFFSWRTYDVACPMEFESATFQFKNNASKTLNYFPLRNKKQQNLTVNNFYLNNTIPFNSIQVVPNCHYSVVSKTII